MTMNYISHSAGQFSETKCHCVLQVSDKINSSKMSKRREWKNQISILATQANSIYRRGREFAICQGVTAFIQSLEGKHFPEAAPSQMSFTFFPHCFLSIRETPEKKKNSMVSMSGLNAVVIVLFQWRRCHLQQTHRAAKFFFYTYLCWNSGLEIVSHCNISTEWNSTSCLPAGLKKSLHMSPAFTCITADFSLVEKCDFDVFCPVQQISEISGVWQKMLSSLCFRRKVGQSP